MLIKQPQIRIVSKEVTLGTGEVVLAYFALVNTEGVIEARFLGTKPIPATEDSNKTPVALLENICSTVCLHASPKPFFARVSPFFTLDFLVNQLARAPSVR